jgi:ubiquinone/menaquinone biosynthesis C-methylase UbiE
MLNLEIDVSKIMRSIKKDSNFQSEEGDVKLSYGENINSSCLISEINKRVEYINNVADATITSLDVGTKMPQMTRFKGLKRRVLSFLAKLILRVGKIVTRDQVIVNRNLFSITNALLESVNIITSELNSTKVTVDKIIEIKSEIETISKEMSQKLDMQKEEMSQKLDMYKEEVSRKLDVYKEEMFQQFNESNHKILEKSQNNVDNIFNKVSYLNNMYLDNVNNINDIREKFMINSSKIDNLQYRYNKNEQLTDVCNNNKDIEFDDVLNYLYFENKFRGNTEEIKRKQRFYLKHIEQSSCLEDNSLVLDLGCGRGEWISLIKEKFHLNATGIDLNENMVNHCIENGLNAKCMDMFEYLNSVEDESVSVITLFQVAEHLTFSQLNYLISEAYRILKKKGIIIIETPNPLNLIVGSANFYLDPTHKQPIHPKLLGFYMEMKGFMKQETLYWQQEEFEKWWRDLENIDTEEIKSVRMNATISMVNTYLNAPADYAIVGRK